MNQRITKTFVDKLPLPPEINGKPAQAFYRDSAVPGFGLRVNSGGSKSFIVEKRINGKVKRITLGRYGNLTVEQARNEAAKLLGEVALGKDPAAEKKAKHAKATTLLETFDDYLLTRKNLRDSTIHDYSRNIHGPLADWKNKALLDITKDMVELRHRELGKRSHARANNVMRLLRALFNHAMAKYEDAQGNPVIAVNPVNRLSQSRAWYTVKPRQTLIKPHQLADWYQATLQLNTETTRDYLHLLLFTGLRRSEASRLRWEDVDFKGKSLTIKETKNHQTHTLPLSDFLEDLLKRRYESSGNSGTTPGKGSGNVPGKAIQDAAFSGDGNSGNVPGKGSGNSRKVLKRGSESSENLYVFPSESERGYLIEPRTAVQRVSEISGVPFTLHDLRRTFITIAESLDIPAYALKRLLNHKDPNDVTAGYIISDVERLRAPMQKITDFILDKTKAIQGVNNVI